MLLFGIGSFACGVGCVSKGDTNVSPGTTGGTPGTGGASGGQTSSGGSAGAVAPDLSKLGDACATHADCGGALECLAEGDTGWPKGYCAAKRSGTDCPAGSVELLSAPHAFVMHDGKKESPVCAKGCQQDGECRSGYACLPSFDTKTRSYGLKACAAWPQAAGDCSGSDFDALTYRCKPQNPQVGSALSTGACDPAEPEFCRGACFTKPSCASACNRCITPCRIGAGDCDTGQVCTPLSLKQELTGTPGACLDSCASGATCKISGDQCFAQIEACAP